MKLNKDIIYLDQYRSMIGVFNDTLKYVRQNIGLLVKLFLFFAVPFVLVNSSVDVWYADRLAHLGERMVEYANGVGYNSYRLFIEYSWLSLLIFLCLIAQQWALNVVACSHVFEYDNKNISSTFNDVTGRMLSQWKKIVMLSFVLLFVFLIGKQVTLIPIFLSAYLGHLFLGIWRVLSFLIEAFFYFPTLFITCATLNYLYRYNLSVRKSISKSWQIFKGNFWRTWLVVALAELIFLLFKGICYSPEYMFSYFIMDLDIFGLGDLSRYDEYLTIAQFAESIVYGLFSGAFYILLAIYSYTLIERKEGYGIVKRINEIGKR